MYPRPDLEEIEERLQQAAEKAPGVWALESYPSRRGLIYACTYGGLEPDTRYDVGDREDEEIWRFIAYAPEDIRELLNYVDHLEKKLCLMPT